jgi:hypothetical protein
MFSSSFRERQQLLSEEIPVIELGDDDPEAMGLIMRVLHYQGTVADRTMSVKSLARLAIQCDKYDFTRSLGPWTTTWLQNVRTNDNSAEAFGFRILAAYMFGDSKGFRDITRLAILQLNPAFSANWDREELLSIIPLNFIG